MENVKAVHHHGRQESETRGGDKKVNNFICRAMLSSETLPSQSQLPLPGSCRLCPSVPGQIRSLGGHEGGFSRNLLPVLGNGRPSWAVLAQIGTSTLWHCPSTISSADRSIAHPPMCPEGWVCRGCWGVWHAQTMQVSVSWQLPEEVPVDPLRSWSCLAPSRWSCVPCKRCGEVSSSTWFQKPESFSFCQSQLAGSMFHSHRGG